MTDALPHGLDRGLGARARIGLIVLSIDQTIEHEWGRMLGAVEGVAVYVTRLWCDPVITPITLAAMADGIAPAARLLAPLPDDAVVAFGCTSATMVLGEAEVAVRVRSVRPRASVTTPIGAALTAFRTMDVRRLGVLTPYRADVNDRVRTYIEGAGFTVGALASFHEEQDDRAARIDAASIHEAATGLARSCEVDAVLVSCTSLRVADLVTSIERECGKPVTSSNHAMAWHALRLAGVHDRLPQWGRVFTV